MSSPPVINSVTEGMSFGVVPRIKVPGLTCEQAEIHLFEGRHWGPNRGFGRKHIWAEHQTEMLQMGFRNEEQVGHYVASIVRSGSSLYFEGGFMRQPRLLVVNRTVGTAVLECRSPLKVWSIVTAYSGKQAHGTFVGTVR